MENFILRIACITLNELVNISKETNLSNISFSPNENVSSKELLQLVMEDLDSIQTKKKNHAILTLFRSIIVNSDVNFLFESRLDKAFNMEIIEICLEMNVLNELAKNLTFMFTKFIEISK